MRAHGACGAAGTHELCSVERPIVERSGARRRDGAALRWLRSAHSRSAPLRASRRPDPARRPGGRRTYGFTRAKRGSGRPRRDGAPGPDSLLKFEVAIIILPRFYIRTIPYDKQRRRHTRGAPSRVSCTRARTDVVYRSPRTPALLPVPAPVPVTGGPVPGTTPRGGRRERKSADT